MVNVDLNQFRDWQQEAPERRSVTIELSKNTDDKHAIWAYDYRLMVGQFVQSATEIDLEGVKRKKMEHAIKEAQDYLGRSKE